MQEEAEVNKKISKEELSSDCEMVKFGLSQQQPIETLILVIRQSAGCSVLGIVLPITIFRVALTQLIRERAEIVKTSLSHLTK